ncbi:sensor histidine kinase [Terrimonas ferruginea]|uniref:sensor histidine kinase n=1 Tax=Terrimonas ferruginea TaxID=249 RepID=UPI000688DFFE|nr:histidine kinase [Terrimonas ferruginea]
MQLGIEQYWLGNKRYWIFQACGWGMFILVHLFFNISFNKMSTWDDWELFLGRIGIFVVLGVVFTHLMRMVIIWLNVLQKKLEKQGLIFLVITTIFALIAAFFNIHLLRKFKYLAQAEQTTLNDNNFILVLLSNAFNFFIFYFIWNLIYFMYHYIAKSQKQQLDTLQLESLVKELELKTIKAHINPHFIFNSLNSIRALVDENPERARKAITELSNILRSSINVDKSETVTFEKELAIVKDYLALETMRFEDRLQVEYEVDDDTLASPVPPMMLQTLVENAIKHGISKQINGGIVRVISDFSGNYHELTVQNTGQLSTDKLEEGFGLSSTNDRLQLLYGPKGRFQIRQLTPALVEARVLIPVNA